MSTVKFDLQKDLEELQAKIYLDTKKKLSKKEILEIAFNIGTRNYKQIISEILYEEKALDDEMIQSILENAVDFGEGTEKLSSQVNKIVYNVDR